MSAPADSILTFDDNILWHICQSFHQDLKSTGPYSPLKALSLTCRRIRSQAIPALFRNTLIRAANVSCTTIPPVVHSLTLYPNAERHARTLFIEPVTAKDDYDHYSCMETSKRLATSLQLLPNLHTLSIGVVSNHPGFMWPGFKDPGVQLPSIKTLIVTASHYWLAPICPNLETLIIAERHGNTGRFGQLMVECSKLNHLRHLESSTVWPRPNPYSPNSKLPSGLRALGLATDHTMFDPVAPALPPVLAQLKQLQAVYLGHTRSLGMGYNPPRCGNAYRGRDGPARRAELKAKKEEVERTAAQIIFDSCSTVEEVWYQNQVKVAPVRNADGSITELVHSQEARFMEWNRTNNPYHLI